MSTGKITGKMGAPKADNGAKEIIKTVNGTRRVELSLRPQLIKKKGWDVS